MKLQKSQPPDSLSSCLYTNPIKSINIFDLSTISIVPQASTSQTKQPTERPALFCGYQCYFWTSQVNPSYPGFLPEGDFKRTISKRQDGVYDGTWVWAHDTASPVPIELVIDEVVRSYNNDPTSTLEQLIEKISRYEHDVEEDYESDTGVIDDEEVFDEQAVEGGMNDGEAIDEEAVEGGMNDEDVIDEEVIDGGMNDEDLIDEESEDEEVVAEECCNGEIVDKEAVEANFVEEDGDEVIDDEDGESNDIVYEDPFPSMTTIITSTKTITTVMRICKTIPSPKTRASRVKRTSKPKTPAMRTSPPQKLSS